MTSKRNGNCSTITCVSRSLAGKEWQRRAAVGSPAFIAWNEKSKQYACAWLDVYGGASAESIGLATPKENELAFVFNDEHGQPSFANTLYLRSEDQYLA